MAKKDFSVVVAHYQYLDDIIGAIAKVKAKGIEDFKTFAPFPCHDLEEAVYKDKARSPVRFFTLLGGLTGCCGAFLMTIWMSIDYPIRVSAKPEISIPAFVVVGFECTILLGAIFTLLSMFHFARLPDIFHWPEYRPNFSNGTFGLTVRVPNEQANALKGELEGTGAELVEVQYVR